MSFCRAKRLHVFRVRSHQSFQYLYDAPVQRRITPIDDHFTSHVCGFCVTSLGLRSGSRPAHQATHQSFPTGTSGATQNHALVGPSSCAFGINETVFASECDDQGENSDDVIPLKWRTMKTVFLLALTSTRRRSYIHALSVAPGRCVFSRGNTQRQLVVSLLPEHGFIAKNPLPSQAPEWISVPGIAHLNPSEAEKGCFALSGN